MPEADSSLPDGIGSENENNSADNVLTVLSDNTGTSNGLCYGVQNDSDIDSESSGNESDIEGFLDLEVPNNIERLNELFFEGEDDDDLDWFGFDEGFGDVPEMSWEKKEKLNLMFEYVEKSGPVRNEPPGENPWTTFFCSLMKSF